MFNECVLLNTSACREQKKWLEKIRGQRQRKNSGQRQNSCTTDMPYVLYVYVYSAQCLSLEGRYLEIGVSWMQ